MTGLVAQQQCVGPLHTPVADVAITALTHFDIVGSATAIGEQPIKGLVSPACGAHMAVGEALTNLVFARITDLKVSKEIIINFYFDEIFLCWSKLLNTSPVLDFASIQVAIKIDQGFIENGQDL